MLNGLMLVSALIAGALATERVTVASVVTV
jgi:hypothetical protein